MVIPMKLAPPPKKKQLWGLKMYILERKFRLRRLQTAVLWKRGQILRKLKQLV